MKRGPQKERREVTRTGTIEVDDLEKILVDEIPFGATVTFTVQGNYSNEAVIDRESPIHYTITWVDEETT